MSSIVRPARRGRGGIARHGPDAHVGGVDAGDAEGDDAGQRLGAELLGAVLGGDHQAGGAVVEGRRVAGGDGAALAERRPQPRQLLERGVGARALVGVDHDGLAALRRRDRHDLLGEAAGLLGGDRAPVAAQREVVLVLARDPVALGDVLRRLAHRLGRVAAPPCAG